MFHFLLINTDRPQCPDILRILLQTCTRTTCVLMLRTCTSFAPVHSRDREGTYVRVRTYVIGTVRVYDLGKLIWPTK